MSSPRKSNTKSIQETLLEAFTLNSALTIAIAPAVSISNCASGISSVHRIWGKKLICQIHSGKFNLHAKVQKPGVHNFLSGLVPHTIHQLSRGVIRVPAISVALPKLEEKYSPKKAAQINALGMAMGEAIWVTFFNNWRIRRQTGIGFSFALMLKGAGTNGIKQYATWSSYGVATTYSASTLKKLGIDPQSTKGILIRAPFEAIFIVGAFWPFETVINQVASGKYTTVIEAGKTIFEKEGIKGIYRGAIPKIPGTILQHSTTLFLYRQGKRRLESEAEKKTTPKRGMQRAAS